MQRATRITGWSPGLFGRGPGRRLVAVALSLSAVLTLGWVVWAAAGLYVDWLWFDSLGYAPVFGTRLASQLALFAAAGLCCGALCLANLRLARQLRSGSAAAGAAEEGLWTYLARVNASLTGDTLRTRRAERGLLGLAVLLTLLFALHAARQVDVWLLAIEGAPFGRVEPFFRRD